MNTLGNIGKCGEVWCAWCEICRKYVAKRLSYEGAKDAFKEHLIDHDHPSVLSSCFLSDIEIAIEEAERAYGRHWETIDGWEKLVCRPVVDYRLAPRQARAILMLAGELLTSGVSISSILRSLKSLMKSDDQTE
jgi:hypothetical protein